eukprot:TRINITY_DN1538_c0_g1_i1.p2 TRINITY_DN1538_c0_g1~~TRINITY_DN1538_c0_g1_i1.p2  ORF type:complete len:458 (+),score=121.13 TRINITY_DN1538_c0_g1_i1:636-2009(+)
MIIGYPTASPVSLFVHLFLPTIHPYPSTFCPFSSVFWFFQKTSNLTESSFFPLYCLPPASLIFVSPNRLPCLTSPIPRCCSLCSHIYRQYTDYMGWSMDFTGPQMIITIKLTTFAYNYHDGQLSDAEAEKTLYPEQKKQAIKEMPSLLEFYSFIYFFGTYMAGPAVDIKDYLDYINGDMFDQAKDKKNPFSLFTMLFKLILGFACAGVFQWGGANFPLAHLHSEEFLANSLVYRHVYLMISVTLTRYKYYFAWSLAEGALVACGMAFNGYTKDGSIKWDRALNVNILDVELGQSMKQVTDNWNIGTARWLRNCVYWRLAPPGARVPAYVTVVTYMTSAFWHGFYPGYYMTFATGAFITEVGKGMRRTFNAKAKAAGPVVKFLYDMGCIVAVSVTLNFAGAAFLLLDYNYATAAWGAVNYSTLFILGPMFLWFQIFPPKSGKKKDKKESKKEDSKKDK